MHVHSVLLSVIHIQLRRPIPSDWRPVTQDPVVVVVSLVDRLVPLTRIGSRSGTGIIIDVLTDVLDIRFSD